LDLTSFAILHFATHGLIDERRPERSGLVLTAQPAGDDGILQMREVYRWRLRGALVTLSACDTALGVHVRGEGIISLSRAFFYAGADAVIATLWSVNDRSTSQFMADFYRALSTGIPVTTALRQTQRQFLQQDGPLRAPFYWAPFIVTGDGDWRRTPTPRSTPWWSQPRLAIAVLLIALFLSLIVRNRRSRSFLKSA
jgi:CHAT domain-containing protein